jgi:predicted ferric reductase
MKRFFLPVSLVIVALWAVLQPEGILTFAAPFFSLRNAYTTLTGALALGWMGFCMVLALRPSWLERRLDGLDKLYYVHKWTGIAAVLMVVAHWLLVLSPRTLIAWGWIEAATRQKRPHGNGFSWIGQGKEMGEWAAWGMIVLGIVSLLRFVPYNWFRKLHKGFPIIFLLGAYHSVTMLWKEQLLATPFGIALMVICVVGGVVAFISLRGSIGASRRHAGQVVRATSGDSGVLELAIAPGRSWPGHTTGQFALLTLDRDEGPHPFSIVSEWQPGAELCFAIKPLGDYTRTLPGRIRAGDPVIIEGPYGGFDFGDTIEDQVWVAGGVGVAPFLARLRMLAKNGGAGGRVHLFYSARDERDLAFPAGLETLCRQAGVQLHQRVTAQEGRFSDAEIGQLAGKAASVWFCGPTRWGKTLQTVLHRDFGLAAQRFHRELFEFR